MRKISAKRLEPLIKGIRKVVYLCPNTELVWQVSKVDSAFSKLNDIFEVGRLDDNVTMGILIDFTKSPLRAQEGFKTALLIKNAMKIPNSELSGDDKKPIIRFTIGDLRKADLARAADNLNAITPTNIRFLRPHYDEADIFTELVKNLGPPRSK